MFLFLLGLGAACHREARRLPAPANSPCPPPARAHLQKQARRSRSSASATAVASSAPLPAEEPGSSLAAAAPGTSLAAAAPDASPPTEAGGTPAASVVPVEGAAGDAAADEDEGGRVATDGYEVAEPKDHGLLDLRSRIRCSALYSPSRMCIFYSRKVSAQGPAESDPSQRAVSAISSFVTL